MSSIAALVAGVLAILALARQPFLEHEGVPLTATQLRSIVAIGDTTIGSDFFDPLPGAQRTAAEWWRLQNQVWNELGRKKRVVLHITTASGVHEIEARVARPGLAPIANDVAIFLFCGLFYVAGALFVVVRHPTRSGLLLAVDFVSSAVTLFCAGATSLRHVALPYETHRLLVGLSATGVLGFLVSTHFFLSFPTPKRFVARIPPAVVAAVYGAPGLLCVLVYLGAVSSAWTLPASAALNVAMLLALIHSLAAERDGFLRLQLGILLFVMISGFAVLYAWYAFAALAGLQPLEPEHIALMFLVGLFAFVAVFENATLYLQKRRGEEAAQAEREHLRQELHDHLLNRLANIALLSDAALRADGTASALDKVAAIKREAGASSRYARGLLWISNEGCSWDELFSHLRQQGHECLAPHDLEFELIGNRLGAPCAAPLPVRACLYKVLLEAMTNTVKHGCARSARVTIEVTATRLECRYADDGRGFDPSTARPGHFGLAHMHRAAQQAGGTLVIESCAAAGMSLTLCIPL